MDPESDRCDWHYLVSAINANGTVSPCCGVQDESEDFGSLVGSGFHDVWGNPNFTSARRALQIHEDPAQAEVPTTCHDCGFPEDQLRAHYYVKRYLREAPVAVRWQGARYLPLKNRFRLLAPPRRSGRKVATAKYANMLRALEEQAQGSLNPQSQPIGLILDPCSACGLRCPSCPVSYTPSIREKTMMDNELFERILEELGQSLFFVDFFSWGEPLLNKNLPAMLARLRDYDIDTRVSTSLSCAMTEDMEKALIENLRLLTLSIDGTTQENYEVYRRRGDLALVMSNLERLVERARKMGKSPSMIEWQFLVFSFNEHELPEARQRAKDLGLSFHAVAPYIDTNVNPDWVSSIPKYAR